MLKEFLASLAPVPVASEPVVEQPNKFEEYIANQKTQRDSDFQQQMDTLGQIQSERNVETPLITERTKTDAAVDITAGVAQGVWGTLTGGLGAFVDAETLMKLNSVTEDLDSLKSDQLRNDVADYQYRTAQYNKTIEKAIMNGQISDFEGEKLIAWNALKSMSPGQLESIGTSAAGSMGVLIAAAATGNPAAIGAAWTAMTASTIAEPADMILQELYAKNTTGDFNITHDDLMVSSEIYIKAFEETGDETEARNALYRYAVNDAVWDAVNLAGSTLEMLGEYATLRLAKIVKPMKKGASAGRFKPVTGMFTEAGTEVAGQVGSTISANKAIAETGIDPERRKYSGTGEGVVEAAIGGGVGSGVASASKPVMIAGSVAGSIIGARRNRGEPEVEGAAETAQAAQQADESLNNLRQAAEPVQGTEPTEEQTAVNNVLTKIDSGFAWTPYTEEDGFSESIRSATGEATSTVDAMNRLADRVLSGELTPEEVAEYGTAIQSIFAETGATINEMAPAIDALGEESDAYQHAMSWVENVNKVIQNPQLNKALTAAREAVANKNAVIDTNVPVAEQTEATKALKQKVALNPDSLTEEEITNAKMVMEDLIETGVLSETDRTNIDILSGQIEAAKKLNKKPDGSVANQVLFDEVDGEKGASVATYATEVVSDITHGNHEGAAEKLATLSRFIQSHTNKKEALERSRDNGNQEETYKTTSPKHTNPVDKKISFFKSGGQNLLNDVNTELGFMRDVYEQLRTIAPFETKALPPLVQPKKATTVEEAARVPEPEANTPKEAGVISQGFKDQVKELVDRRIQTLSSRGPAALAEELRSREKQLADATVGTRNYYSTEQLVNALQEALGTIEPEAPITRPDGVQEEVPTTEQPPQRSTLAPVENAVKQLQGIRKQLDQAQKLEDEINNNPNHDPSLEDQVEDLVSDASTGLQKIGENLTAFAEGLPANSPLRPVISSINEAIDSDETPEIIGAQVAQGIRTLRSIQNSTGDLFANQSPDVATEQPPVADNLANDGLAADPYADIDTGEEAAPRVDIPEPKPKAVKESPVQALTDLLKSLTTAEYATLAQQVADVLDYPKRLLSNIWSGRVGPKTLEDAPLEQIEQMAQEIIDNRDKSTPPEPTKPEPTETVTQEEVQTPTPEVEPAVTQPETQGTAVQETTDTEAKPEASARATESLKNKVWGKAVKYREGVTKFWDSETPVADMINTFTGNERTAGLGRVLRRTANKINTAVPQLHKDISSKYQTAGLRYDSTKPLQKSDSEIVETGLKPYLTDEQIASISGSKGTAADTVKMAKNLLVESGQTPEQADAIVRYIQQDIAANRPATRMVSLMERNADGELEFTNDILGAVSLALTDFFVGYGPNYGQLPMDTQELASFLEAFGYDPDSKDSIHTIPVRESAKKGSPEYEVSINALLTQGLMTHAEARARVTDLVMQILGVTPDSNAYEGNIYHPVENLVGTLMERILEKEDARRIYIMNANGGATLAYIAPRDKRSAEFNTDGQIGTITDELLLNKEQKRYINKKPTARTISKNGMPLSKKQQEAQEYENSIPFKLNQNMQTVLASSLGEEGIVEAFGFPVSDNMNRYDREAKEGKNIQLVNAIVELQNIESDIFESGSTNAEAEIYYNSDVTSVNRSMMEGGQNPKASKVVRAAVSPNATVVDMTGVLDSIKKGTFDSLSDIGQFTVLAYAQAFGISIHNLNHQQSLEKLRKILTHPQFEDIATQWFNLSQSGDRADSGLIQRSKDLLGNDWSEIALQTVVEYGALLNTDNPSEFTTHAYIEADGITNGPFMAAMIAGMDIGSAQWRQFAANGGLYIGEDINSNEYRSQKSAEGALPDNYNMTAIKAKEAAQMQRQSALALASEKGIAGQFQNHDMVADDFIVTVFGMQRDADDEIIISRSAAKNPVTVTFYGSGVKGIGSKFAGEAVDTINRLSSVMLQNQENGVLDVAATAIAFFANGPMANLTTDAKIENLTNLFDLIPILTSSEKIYGVSAKTGKAYAFISSKVPNSERQTRPYTLVRKVGNKYIVDPEQLRLGSLNAAQRQKLTANMTEYLAKPLATALEEVAGSTLAATDTIQKVTDRYSQLVEVYFSQLLTEAKTQPEYDPRNGFSPKQVRDIIESLNSVGVETEIAGKMFSLVKKEGEATGASFEGSNNGAATMNEKGDPTSLNQTSRMPNAGKLGVAGIPRFVQAFGDAATITNFVLMAKEAGIKKFMQIYDGINMSADNYLELSQFANDAVLESVNDRPLNGLQAMMEKGIKKIPSLLKDKGAHAQLIEEAQSHLTELGNLTEQVNTNLDTLNEYEYSIDQMAAVGKNALHKGKQIEPEELNGVMSTTNKALEMSGKSKLMPVKVATDAQIRDTIKTARKMMPDNMKNLVGAIYKQFTASGATLKVVEDGKSHFNTKSNIAFIGSRGQTVGARTVIHEMAHATVSRKIQAIASGERVIAKTTLQAYEGLKSAFNEASVASNRHTNRIWGKAIEHALNTQARFLKEGLTEKQAEAAMLDEFLVSFLTTPELVEQSQTFELSNPFVKLASAAWKIIKDILGLSHVPDNTLHSALVQSWAEITTADVSVMTQARMDMLDFGSTPSERAARESMEQIALGLSPVEKAAAKAEVLKSVDEATDVFDVAGFLNTPEQKESFRAGAFVIQAAGQTDRKEIQGLYSLARHIVKNLKPEHFGDTTIPDSPSYYMAQNKYGSVMGMFSGDYSSLVPNLMGLVYASQEMKDIVNQIEMPKGEKGFDRDSKMEERLGTLGYTAIHKLANKLDGIGGNVPADVVQTLVEGLGKKPEGGVVSELSTLPSIAYDKANEIVSNTLERIGGALEQAGDFVASETKTGKAIGLGLKALGGILNEDSAEAAAEGVTTVLNSIDGGKPWKDMLHDMIGRQQSNAITYDLIKQVRSTVQRMRQMYVESTPTNIKKRFTNEPTAEQWTDLTKTMIKTDIAAVAQEHGVENTLNMLLDKKAVKDRIKQLEQSILNDQGDGQARLQKAKQLASYMVTGKTGSNLLTNANDIAHLYGEDGQTKTVSKGLTNKIDEYVSLVAFSGSNNSTFELLTKTEREGIHYTLTTMVGNRKEEQRKAQTAGVWGFKGYTPMPHDGHLAIVRDSDAERYLKKGYVRVGDYVNSSSDPDRTKKGYYISNLSASRPFAQGIIQNAVVSVNGVVAETGESMNTSTAPMDLRHLDLDRMSGKLQGDTATYGLIPSYDHEGNLIGAVRAIDPSVMEALNQNTSLPELLGIQRGRQVEESVANNFNTVIADELNREYERSNKKGEFVNLLDPELAKSDKVVGDALSIMNREFLRYGKSQYGKIMVKKEMLNNVVGYRQLGLASIFDGTTNMDERTRKAIVQALEQYIGPKAYYYLVRNEEIWRGIVGDAKQLIVVKSVIVPAINALSNIVHLMGRGVPIADIVTGIPRKLAEVEKYSSAQKRLIEIEGEMLAAEGKPSEITKLQAEKALLEEANARLSIAPLLRAGEFASIVSAKIDQESSNLQKGKIAEYMEGQINRLDGGMKTTAKNLLMTKDTAVYQFLQKSVDYGDFIAKSIIYDDIVSRQGRSPEYAIGKVREEFINYDYLPGRFRGFLEGNGLLWFYNFKMRSMKIAISMIRENPLHTVVSTSVVPMSTPFGNLGIPTDDNILYKLVDGTAQYSVGPEMGIRSWQLHPLYQILK